MSNKRKCFVGGKLGLVIQSYTHTVDVFLFKEKRITYGVHKKYVKLLPRTKTGNPNQLRINYE